MHEILEDVFEISLASTVASISSEEGVAEDSLVQAIHNKTNNDVMKNVFIRLIIENYNPHYDLTHDAKCSKWKIILKS